MNNITSSKKKLSSKQRDELLGTLKARFEKNMNRHKGLDWAGVQTKLEADAKKLWSLSEMERTGGEPDVVGYDKKTGEFVFYDCSAESPKGRRSICYDREALEARKEHKPANSAVAMATDMGIDLLTEEQYRELQQLGNETLDCSARDLHETKWKVDMKVVLSLCCVTLAMLLHPNVSNNQSESAFRTIKIFQTELGYSYFESMAITTGEDFNAFLAEIPNQTGWNNRQGFVDALVNAKIDFNREALVLLRHDEPSGSVEVSFETPVLKDKTLFCETRGKPA